MPHSRVLAASLLFLLLAAPPLMAADTYWSGNGSSDNFSDLGNWFDHGFGQFNPNPGNNINFNNSLGAPHTWAFDDYGVNGWFGNIISYNNAGYIKVYGGTTYCYKFENNNNGSLFEAAADLSNRTGPDTDLQINHVGSGGIAVSNVVMQDGMQLKVYGGNTLTVNGVISETGSVTKSSTGTVQLIASSANW